MDLNRLLRQYWLSIAATITTAMMMISLYLGFLDQFVVGAHHGAIGLDFFSVPRAFLNLQHGVSIYATEENPFGPYATWYPYHPAIALLVGSWTALFSPEDSYLAFVLASLVMMFFAARLIAVRMGPGPGAGLAYFAIFAAAPTYLLLWNAQMHVFTVLAIACILAGLLDQLGFAATKSLSWASGNKLIIAGLLISLFSKPLLALLVPLLLLLHETRRATIISLVVYAVGSVIFFIVPELNPGNHNLVHWTNIFQQSSSRIDLLTGVQFRDNPEIFSLPAFIDRLAPDVIPTIAFKIPLIVVVVAAIAAAWSNAQRRASLTLIAALVGVQAYYLSYPVIWEYHYTTLLPTIPILWLMYRREMPGAAKLSLAIAFWASLLILLPTPYFLFGNEPDAYITFCRLTRVGCVAVAFLATSFSSFFVRRGALNSGREVADALPPKLPMRGLMLAGSVVLLALLVGATWPNNRLSVLLGKNNILRFEKLLELQPDWTNARVSLALAYEEEGKHEVALAVMQDAKNHGANRVGPDEYRELGEQLILIREERAAADYYYQASLLFPESAIKHQSKALSLLCQGKPAQAEAELRVALKSDPANLDSHLLLADTIWRLGRSKEALLTLQQSAQQFPDNPIFDYKINEYRTRKH